MKANFFLIGVLSIFFLISCSSDNEESICSDVLEPIGNEFTFNCSRYSTENGKLNIKPTSWLDGTTSCMIRLINNPYGNNILKAGDRNINFVNIWLIVPVDAYYDNEIPTGRYKLKNLNSEINEQYLAMDIADWNQVVFDGDVIQSQSSGSTIFNNGLIASEFDDIIVDVSKVNSVYTIEYYMKKGEKQIKGKFVGEMTIVHHWN